MKLDIPECARACAGGPHRRGEHRKCTESSEIALLGFHKTLRKVFWYIMLKDEFEKKIEKERHAASDSTMVLVAAYSSVCK